MQRIQAIELEDLPWVPNAIRDGATDILDLLFDKLRFYQGVAQALPRLLAQTQHNQLIDLCSGGGGGTLSVVKSLPELKGVKLTFTDLYPNAAAIARITALANPRFSYCPESIDAFAVPASWQGVRTMSGALHHFPPVAIEKLLASLIAQQQSFVFFDVAAAGFIRRLPFWVLWPSILFNFVMALFIPLVMGLVARPWRWDRFFFIYVLPIIPLLFAWDGTVSALRAYEPDELLALARNLPGAKDYVWEAKRVKSALYFMGYPRR